jgi:hypothetical protein
MSRVGAVFDIAFSNEVMADPRTFTVAPANLYARREGRLLIIPREGPKRIAGGRDIVGAITPRTAMQEPLSVGKEFHQRIQSRHPTMISIATPTGIARLTILTRGV